MHLGWPEVRPLPAIYASDEQPQPNMRSTQNTNYRVDSKVSKPGAAWQTNILFSSPEIKNKKRRSDQKGTDGS